MHKKHLVILIIVVFLALFGRLIFEAVRLSPVLFELLFHKEIELKQTQKRVNLLLLGIGGEQHDGPLLTDTIIYASIDPEKKKVTLVSLPRDLWFPKLNQKINTAYAFGEKSKKGGGLILAKTVIAGILDQPIDYAFRIDFRGFIKAIDMVGGVDIEVKRGFEDFEYPITGKENDTCGFKDEEFQVRATASSILEAFPCRFEHVSFSQGLTHMDGQTALKFVRSRHSKSLEGTDMARSERQEQVITAFKEKILSLNTFLNPVRLTNLYDVFRESIDTDIEKSEYDDFVKLFQKVKDAKIQSVVFFYTTEDEKAASLLINPSTSSEYNGQWVLIPRKGNGNFSEIQDYTKCVLISDMCVIK